MSTLLASSFNQSAHQREVPISFKIANVCLVPKGGGVASDVFNCRPIFFIE